MDNPFIQEQTIKSIVFSYNKNVQPKNLRNLDIPNCIDFLRFEPIKFNYYETYFVISSGKIYFNAGCTGSCTIDDVNNAILDLDGKSTTEDFVSIVKKDLPAVAKSKVEYLEQSGNYFISKSLKAYSINEYELRRSTVSRAVLKFNKTRSVTSYKGYDINISGQNLEIFRNKLFYLKSTMEYIQSTYLDKIK